MGASAPGINVKTVGSARVQIEVGAEGRKDHRSRLVGGAIGHVDGDFDSRQREIAIHRSRSELGVFFCRSLNASDATNRFPDWTLMIHGMFVFGLNGKLGFVGQLVAICAEEFYTVVLE